MRYAYRSDFFSEPPCAARCVHGSVELNLAQCVVPFDLAPALAIVGDYMWHAIDAARFPKVAHHVCVTHVAQRGLMCRDWVQIERSAVTLQISLVLRESKLNAGEETCKGGGGVRVGVSSARCGGGWGDGGGEGALTDLDLGCTEPT
jgi:hypothetical protein